MNRLNQVNKALQRSASRERARNLLRYFKTGPGEYAEGDKFIGVSVPDIRKISGNFRSLGIKDLLKLLRSGVHEERLLALLIFVEKFEKSGEKERSGIYRLYLQNTRHINNWDLVDLSAPRIIGAFLADKDKKPLYGLVRSKSLWERRIAILATFSLIKNGDFKEALRFAEMLLTDKEDLIHKAVGWMLREVGKRDQEKLEKFLEKNTPRMPRTMLRYAIERLPKKKKSYYLAIPRAR